MSSPRAISISRTLGVDKEAPVGFAEIRLASMSIPMRRRTNSINC
jgi:hypothetical protein